jgi:hypothetical protein
MMLSEVVFASLSRRWRSAPASMDTPHAGSAALLIVLAALWSSFARTPNGEDDRRSPLLKDMP